jgi:hypothetical protein
MRMPRRGWLAFMAAWLVPALGCGNRLVTTTGIVTLDGQPLEAADVQFCPEGPDGDYAHGRSRSDGTFRPETNRADGVRPGSYRVTVIKFETGKEVKVKRSILPKIYSSTDTTPFRCVVPHEGPVRLELQSTEGGQEEKE